MRFHFTSDEKQDLLKSWAAISLAFAIFIAGGLTGIASTAFLLYLLIAAVTVGLGFVLHELAHKWVALSYECDAEYRAENSMLILALLSSLFGFVFAAPGAVHLKGSTRHDQQGMISLAGPVANILLAILFLLLYFLLPEGMRNIAGFGAVINSWLALFNMIPFSIFDGAKVFNWNKAVYGVTVGAATVLAFFSQYALA